MTIGAIASASGQGIFWKNFSVSRLNLLSVHAGHSLRTGFHSILAFRKRRFQGMLGKNESSIRAQHQESVLPSPISITVKKN